MSAAWSGLFGKVPAQGDFLSRNLEPAMRRELDLWTSTHLARRAPETWPAGGLRALLDFEAGLVLICALPSHDAAGRKFPLVGLRDGQGLSLEEANAWCDRAADHLVAVIAGQVALAPPDQGPSVAHSGDDGEAAIWCAGLDPLDLSPESFDAIFSSA
ncbi:MAG: type VI secretion system-associated protein TagF [Pseudomonadota bacterium]